MRTAPLCSDLGGEAESRELGWRTLSPQASALPHSLVGPVHTVVPTNCTCHPSGQAEGPQASRTQSSFGLSEGLEASFWFHSKHPRGPGGIFLGLSLLICRVGRAPAHSEG